MFSGLSAESDFEIRGSAAMWTAAPSEASALSRTGRGVFVVGGWVIPHNLRAQDRSDFSVREKETETCNKMWANLAGC